MRARLRLSGSDYRPFNNLVSDLFSVY